MSYNPNRAAGALKRRRPQPNPHAGVKRSDIVRRRGVAQSLPTDGRVKTKHGVSTTVFESKSFEQRHVFMYSANNTGMGVNKKGDRTVRVLGGRIFVTILEEDGQKSIHEVNEDSYFNFPRGMSYSIATSGTGDAELIITETKDYMDNWKELEGETVNVNRNDALFVAPVNTVRRRGKSKAKQQAEALAKSKGDRSAAVQGAKSSRIDNVNSSTVIGVNPKPMGPPTDD